jgi:glycosyltransferase involved in cell wall biosynthesis
MTAPPVSVVLPVFNRAATIRGAMQSVLRQTWPDFELIVVDDGSTDGTPEAAAGVADPRIRLVANPGNLGAAAARNTGIRAARGAWVAFQDSDDEWLPLKLEKQMARLLVPGADFVAAYCGMLVIGSAEGGELPGGRPQVAYVPRPDLSPVEGNILTTLMRASIVSTQTLVARRDLLLEIGGFDAAMRALIDRECMLRLAQLGPFACVDEPLVLQRFSPNSITRDVARRAEAKARMVEKHRALFARHPRLLAEICYAVARDHWNAGNLPSARAALAEARALRPADPRVWWMAGRLALGRRGARPVDG